MIAIWLTSLLSRGSKLEGVFFWVGRFCWVMWVQQGLKKVPSHCSKQVDIPSGQVTFHSHLHNGQGIRQVICQLNHWAGIKYICLVEGTAPDWSIQLHTYTHFKQQISMTKAQTSGRRGMVSCLSPDYEKLEIGWVHIINVGMECLQ